MAWTNPVNTDWETDDIPTQTMILQQILDNLRHLRGQDGVTDLEGDQNPLTDNTRDLGSVLKWWAEIYGRNIYAGRYKASPNIREMRITWEDPAIGNYQLTRAQTGAGTSSSPGGTGQWVLKVDNDSISDERFDQQVEQNNALDNSWNTGKKPYLRIEFSLNVNDSRTRVFLGFRATPGTALPIATEVHAGLVWNGTNWFGACANGVAISQTANLTVAAGSRHVIEVRVISATDVEFTLDGSVKPLLTSNVPTGSMEFSFLLDNPTGGGAANDSLLTLGELILQEEVP